MEGIDDAIDKANLELFVDFRSADKISFEIALYRNVIPRVLVSSLVKVLKKKFDLICFFFPTPPCSPVQFSVFFQFYGLDLKALASVVLVVPVGTRFNRRQDHFTLALIGRGSPSSVRMTVPKDFDMKSRAVLR